MGKCLYPGCEESEYQGFRGVPLCEDHWFLSQFMAYIVIRNSEKGAPDLVERIEALEASALTGDKVKYIDWFGTAIEETVDSMIWRIKSLQEENTRLMSTRKETE